MIKIKLYTKEELQNKWMKNPKYKRAYKKLEPMYNQMRKKLEKKKSKIKVNV